MLAGRALPLPLRDSARSTSRVHAQLTVRGWKVLLSDDGSANGTFVSRHGAAGPWLPVTAAGPDSARARGPRPPGQATAPLRRLAGAGRLPGALIRQTDGECRGPHRATTSSCASSAGASTARCTWHGRRPDSGSAADTVAVKVLAGPERRLRRPGRRAGRVAALALSGARTDLRGRDGRRGVFYAMRHEPLGSLSSPVREPAATGAAAGRRPGRPRRPRDARGRRCAPGHRAEQHPARQGGSGPGRAGPGASADAGAHDERPGRRGAGRSAGARRPGTHERAAGGAGQRRLVAGRDPAPGLTGHGVFPALVSSDPFTAVRIYLRSQPEPGEDLSDGERAVIVTALHPDPARRYRTAATSPRRWRRWPADPAGDAVGRWHRSGFRTGARTASLAPAQAVRVEEAWPERALMKGGGDLRRTLRLFGRFTAGQRRAFLFAAILLVMRGRHRGRGAQPDQGS